jgi:hypothetical protein
MYGGNFARQRVARWSVIFKTIDRSSCRGLLIGLSALLLYLAGGCGGKPVGEVSGSVTYQGQPIVLGTIGFIDAAGAISTGIIRDGKYQVERVPVGEVTITVQAHELPLEFRPPSDPAAPLPERDQSLVDLPDRFADKKQSGLRYQVVAGPQIHAFELGP